ncbi:MAG TPA: hypothetical protein VNF03_08165 [Patescibacteria group bacterium]|nr:hypothetical protein [Patescibacteria group bacterium]
MTRRQFILSIAVLGTLGVRPARSRAQDERIVYGDIVRWLKTLFHPLDQIGDLIDRTRFVASLTDLEASFEAMHKDTQEIVEILRRSPLDRYKLTQVGTHLSESVGPCAAQLTDVARVLKQQYREQGERIAADLSETLSRKGWLAAIVAQAVRDDELREMARDAEASAKSLAKVTSELAKLVAFIGKQAETVRAKCKRRGWRRCPDDNTTDTVGPSYKR